MNRPDVSNAFNEELIAELTQAFKNLDPSCRAIILTGAGKQFSAGADLNWMKKMASYTEEQNQEDSYLLFDMVNAIKRAPVPTIAKVNGAALGGGAGLVAACDISLGLSRGVFGFTEVKLGLLPAVISGFVMEKIGVNNANRYFLTGERFSAAEAVRIGLLNQHFETEAELDSEVNKVITEIVQSGPVAVRKAKALIARVKEMDLAEPSTKTFVCNQIASIRVSPEGQEGLSAFLQKRKPGWQVTQSTNE